MTGASPSDDPRALRRAALRRATLRLVLGVVVLDALALAVYELGGIAHTAPRTQTIFTAVWTAATAITVAVLLRGVRRARFV
jgi:hypothetical protein